MAGVQDDTAVAALAVAFVALCVSVGQLLQAFFGTAEGFRRCQSSVIGAWSVATRRHLRWGEFRFETKFTTPHIIVQKFVHEATRSELKADANTCCYPIANAGSGKARQLLRERSTYSLIYKFFPTGNDTPIQKGAPARETFELELKNDALPIAYGRGNKAFEKPQSKPLLSLIFPPDSTNDPFGSTSSSRDFVSWALLISQMKSRQETYAKDIPSSSVIEASNPKDEGTRKLDGNDLRTFFAVKLEEYSWDFMAPDVVRPLATISMRALVIAVIRLGMFFQDFDLSKGIFRAQGNGQSVVSYDVRGLGMVIHYHSNQRRAQANPDKTPLRPYMAPSEAADKMIFGIIPGNGERPDIGLVNDDEGKRLSEQPLMALGLQRSHRQRLLKREMPGVPFGPDVLQMALMDLTALWSPFIADLESGSARVCHPWRLNPATTPFLWWDGRKVLKRRLELEKSSQVMNEVYEKLDFLENFFAYDFYCLWEDSFIAEWEDNSRAPDRPAIAHLVAEFEREKETWNKITKHMNGIESVKIEDEAKRFHDNSGDRADCFLKGRAGFLFILNELWQWTERYFADKKTILGIEFKVPGKIKSHLPKPEQKDFFTDIALQHTILANSAIDKGAEMRTTKGMKFEDWASFFTGDADENSQFAKDFSQRGWKSDKGKPMKLERPLPPCRPFMVSMAHLYVDHLDEHLVKPIWQKYQKYKGREAEGAQISDQERREIKEAWWVLVFRGTVWFMSVWMTLEHRPFSAALYDSDTPVWIS